jgi:hypothetical protein
MAKVKTWVWVVVGVAVFCILGLMATAAVGFWFFKTHINIQETTVTAATSDFDQVRARFTSQRPLIELDERGRFLRANTDRPGSETRPQQLTIMAFNPEDDRIVKVHIPFWMLRLRMRGTRISLGRDSFDMEDLKLTVEDLEHFGPTLILDHKDRRGQRVLVWSE